MANKTETFHGWKITHHEEGADPGFHDGRPAVVLEKPGRNTLTIVGRKGVDRSILLERVKVDALQQDLDASPPDDREAWQDRLDKAVAERDRAKAMRVAQADIERRFAAAEQGAES